MLDEEDAIEKLVTSDVDLPDQAEVHKDLLEAHTQQEKERTALDKVRTNQPIANNNHQQLLKQTPSIPRTLLDARRVTVHPRKWRAMTWSPTTSTTCPRCAALSSLRSQRRRRALATAYPPHIAEKPF